MKFAIVAILLLAGLAGAPAMGLLAVTAAASTPVTTGPCDPDDPDCTPATSTTEFAPGGSVSPRVQGALRTAADLVGALPALAFAAMHWSSQDLGCSPSRPCYASSRPPS
jgi:hypothetical protein